MSEPELPRSSAGIARTVLDPGIALACLAWTLAFAYSFAPFDFTPAGVRTPETFVIGEPGRRFVLLLHVLAFTAVGAADRFAFRLTDPGTRVLPTVLARGLLMCLIVEIGQMFEPGRHSRLVDLVANSSGLILGHLSVPLIRRLGLIPWVRADKPMVRASWLRWVLPLAWGIFWCATVLPPTPFVALHDWDSAYHLFIGNEKDGDRPWAGELQYVAFYDRALNALEVQRHFERRPGVPQSADTVLSPGLLAAYDFTQVSQYRITPQGRLSPPDLRIDLPVHYHWTDTPSALVLDGALLASIGPARALSAAIAASGSFSVEVWMRPANLSQSGPARIVGISDGIGRRNFTIGQQEDSLHFRVRNRFNGPNGDEFELRVPDALSDELAQIVATYSQGRSSIFRNGQRFGPIVDLREPSLKLGLGIEDPVSGVVTALLCALNLWVVSSLAAGRHSSVALLVRTLLFGYSFLLVPVIIGSPFSMAAPVSLHIWFGPAMIFCWALLMLASRQTWTVRSSR